MNPDLEEESVSVLDWNWSVIFSGQSTEDRIWKTGSVTTQYAKSYCQHIALFSSISSKVQDYATKNKMCVDTKGKSEKMTVSLILTSSCYQDGRWELGKQTYCLLHCSSSQNDAMYDVTI